MAAPSVNCQLWGPVEAGLRPQAMPNMREISQRGGWTDDWLCNTHG
eukprot:CAMPEP_0171271050 /NCGR_PEP_ID=MMETSP0790-20130122/61030_1 /TAXON_ID=2925 /ORGANISM="Alexandrium catenella, Strain OF101" /LENGTH=45 /DNA_ID= /DNA_START= /DNA_END= /DNA_ORIENTATION=